MKKRNEAVGLIILATFSIAIGQIFWKLAAPNFNLFTLLSNIPLIIGFFFNCTGLILMLMALRRENLSFIHPFLALSFIWTLILANKILGENINLIKIVGTTIILLGVITLGRKS